MDNFCQMWNKLNGEPYTDGVPPPTEYQLQDMGYQGSGHELTPLKDGDLASTSREDAADELERMKAVGINPTKLGEPMSDEEFHRFYGLELK